MIVLKSSVMVSFSFYFHVRHMVSFHIPPYSSKRHLCLFGVIVFSWTSVVCPLMTMRGMNVED